MTESKNPKLNAEEEKIKKEKDKTLEHAEALYKHVKGMANEYLEEGKQSVHEVQDQLKHHKDTVANYVQEKPLTSLLIAGGIGFILSAILRK